NAAASTWDIKALSDIYCEDALFFGLLPALYKGRSEIEMYFGSYQDNLDSVSLNLVEQHIRSLAPGIFLAQGFGDILNRHRNGASTERKVRSSFVIKYVEGIWKISLHHFSLAL